MNLGIEYMQKDMDNCLLLKTLSKNLSNTYSQKLLDTAKKSTTDAIKKCFKESNLKNSRSN